LPDGCPIKIVRSGNLEPALFEMVIIGLSACRTGTLGDVEPQPLGFFASDRVVVGL
jgi:hypothetical protein